MIQILVDKKIKDAAETFAQKMLEENRVQSLWELYNSLKFPSETPIPSNIKETLLGKYREYIKRIIFHYDELLALRFGLFKKYEQVFFNIGLSEDDFSRTLVSKSGKRRSFYMHIVECMDYTKARTFMLDLIKSMNIKCCPYCNACPAETLGDEDEEKIGRYQLDHFFDKHKYAFLCTSFFNLVPSCANCNGKKTDKEAFFYLYYGKHFEDNRFDIPDEVDDPSDITSPFHFSFPNGFSKYALNGTEESIDLQFDEETSLQKEHNRIFFIQKLYEEHKIEVANILEAIIDNNDDNTDILKQTHPKLNFKSERKKRIIFGPYLDECDIHQRAFTKLSIDVAKYFGV